MDYLNEKIPVNLKKMKVELLKEIDFIIEHQLYFLDVIFPTLKNDLKEDEDKFNNKINKFKKNIIKEFKNQIDTDNFVYKIIDNKHCIHKYGRGKKRNSFCCKRITNNGDDKKYVCTIHNKNHIPKIKQNKIKENLKIVPSRPKIEKFRNIDNVNNINSNINIKEDILSKDETFKHEIIYKNKNKKMHLKVQKIKNNIYINNFNINSFKNIVGNIICNNKNCKKNNCIYKHKNNEIPIYDFLYKNNINNNSIIV